MGRHLFCACVVLFAAALSVLSVRATETTRVEVRVHVTDNQGRPVPGVSVTLEKRGGTFWDFFAATSDMTGDATLTDVDVSGTFDLVVRRSHYTPKSTVITIAPGQHSAMSVRMEVEGAGVSGGAAAAAATIRGERELAVVVEGRNAAGEIVPVHYATLYDSRGNEIAMTDYNGHASVRHNVEPGESARLTAEAVHWESKTESFIAGALNGLTDSITFVLEPEVQRTLTVEVLNAETNHPVASASVTLYKPVSFPGTALANGSTGATGEIRFEGESLANAFYNGTLRVGVKASGYTAGIQEVGESSEQEARYLFYLKPAAQHATLVGNWTLASGCSYAGGGKEPNKLHRVAGPMTIERATGAGAYSGRLNGSDMGATIDSASLVGEIVTLVLHPRWYAEEGVNWSAGGWVSRLHLNGKLSTDGHEITGTIIHNGPPPDCEFTMTRR